jgi:hypothetical protein
MDDVPQRNDLRRLPLCALVAYSVRCVRRARPPAPPAREAVPTSPWTDDPKAVKARRDNAVRAWANLKRLMETDLGKFPDQGKPVDPGPNGPMGPL